MASWLRRRERFFRPPYVGSRGWLGMRLDGRVDWEEIEAVCEDAYRTVAPKRLVASLGSTMYRHARRAKPEAISWGT